mmetsp:Transcript_37604/g.99993  ORF Transcript_37604/g.99993 Transcript_37604/m.99993 type:complete len:241 (-) Transcript_37604:356-1078(-)
MAQFCSSAPSKRTLGSAAISSSESRWPDNTAPNWRTRCTLLTRLSSREAVSPAKCRSTVARRVSPNIPDGVCGNPCAEERLSPSTVWTERHNPLDLTLLAVSPKSTTESASSFSPRTRLASTSISNSPAKPSRVESKEMAVPLKSVDEIVDGAASKVLGGRNVPALAALKLLFGRNISCCKAASSSNRNVERRVCLGEGNSKPPALLAVELDRGGLRTEANIADRCASAGSLAGTSSLYS